MLHLIFAAAPIHHAGFWSYSPSSNHCPFCLSDNWHGQSAGFGARLFPLVGLAYGGLTSALVAALLFKVQWWLGVQGQAIVDPRNYRVCYCRLPLLQMLHQSLTKPLRISLRRLVYKTGSSIRSIRRV